MDRVEPSQIRFEHEDQLLLIKKGLTLMSILLVLKSRSRTGPRQTINHQSKPNRSGIAEATGIPF